MRTVLFLAVSIIGVSVALSGLGSAASKKEDYDLQELCGKRAREVFNRDYSIRTWQDGLGQWDVTYVNHYSNKLNKCFMLVRKRLTPRTIDVDPVTRLEALIDINENKPYGGFMQRGNDAPIECKMLGYPCKNEAQWRYLLLPYMEK